MIVILVEGDCERNVLPLLVQRSNINTSIRCIDMKGKSNILRLRNGFEDTIRRQHALGLQEFIVLIDGDITFAPYQTLIQEKQGMQQRAQALAEQLGITIHVAWATLETESWIIAGIVARANYCTLRNIGHVNNNTETSPRDPKRWLQERLGNNYDAATQRCLAQHINIQQARVRNRSLDTFLSLL